MANQELTLKISTIRKSVATVWLVFAVIFGCLAGFHLATSFNVSRPIQVQPALGAVNLNGRDIGLPMVEFQTEFNRYLQDTDASYRTQNLITAAGYFAAFLTALFSALLEFLPRDDHPGGEAPSHTGDPKQKPWSGVSREERRREARRKGKAARSN